MAQLDRRNSSSGGGSLRKTSAGLSAQNWTLLWRNSYSFSPYSLLTMLGLSRRISLIESDTRRDSHLAAFSQAHIRPGAAFGPAASRTSVRRIVASPFRTSHGGLDSDIVELSKCAANCSLRYFGAGFAAIREKGCDVDIPTPDQASTTWSRKTKEIAAFFRGECNSRIGPA